MVTYGMSAGEAIKPAPSHEAALLGMYNKMGSMEIGEFADIIFLHGNPLTNINTLLNVRFVMKSGVIYKK